MKRRIFLGVFAVSMVVMALCLIFVLFGLYAGLQNTITRDLQITAHLIANDVEQGSTDYLNALGEEQRITIIAADGSVLDDTDAMENEMENHAERPEVEQAFATGEGSAIRMSETLDTQTYYYAMLLDDGRVLRISDTQNTLWMQLSEIFSRILPAVGAAAGLSLLLANHLSRQIVQPIKAIDPAQPWNEPVYEELSPIIEHNEQFRETMQREFAANVSHELKTPLTSISGYAEIIKNRLADEKDIPEFAGRIYSESSRLIALINDIMKLSSLDEGSIHAQREDVNMLALCRDVQSTLQSLAEKEGVTIHVQGDAAVVHGVKQILWEIFFNLCENAVKYNVENGHVYVTVTAEKRGVTVCVQDTGAGIPHEHLHKVFDRFYRVDKSHSRDTGGTGLGLSIARQGALFHGASIDVESRVGEGTTMTVRFRVK